MDEENWSVLVDHLFLTINAMVEEGYTELDVLKALSFVVCDLTQEFVESE